MKIHDKKFIIYQHLYVDFQIISSTKTQVIVCFIQESPCQIVIIVLDAEKLLLTIYILVVQVRTNVSCLKRINVLVVLAL